MAVSWWQCGQYIFDSFKEIIQRKYPSHCCLDSCQGLQQLIPYVLLHFSYFHIYFRIAPIMNSIFSIPYSHTCRGEYLSTKSETVYWKYFFETSFYSPLLIDQLPQWKSTLCFHMCVVVCSFSPSSWYAQHGSSVSGRAPHLWHITASLRFQYSAQLPKKRASPPLYEYNLISQIFKCNFLTTCHMK